MHLLRKCGVKFKSIGMSLRAWLMNRRARNVLGCMAMALCIASTAQASPQQTKDLIVIGRLENLFFEHVDIEGDLLGHGWITANLRVAHVVQGKERRRLLKVRYFGHTYLREDKKFRFKLRFTEKADYLICAEPGNSGARCD
jgi:hypothetical protein